MPLPFREPKVMDFSVASKLSVICYAIETSTQNILIKAQLVLLHMLRHCLYIRWYYFLSEKPFPQPFSPQKAVLSSVFSPLVVGHSGPSYSMFLQVFLYLQREYGHWTCKYNRNLRNRKFRNYFSFSLFPSFYAFSLYPLKHFALFSLHLIIFLSPSHQFLCNKMGQTQVSCCSHAEEICWFGRPQRFLNHFFHTCSCYFPGAYFLLHFYTTQR